MGFFYLSQGYSLGSLVLLLPLYISGVLEESYSKAVGISTIIIIPWYIKFIFGILSDNYPILGLGRRKPYLILATVFLVLGWLTIGNQEIVNILFLLSGFSLAIGSALSDSVIDGQIVEITPPTYTGRVQGVAWGARGLGLGFAASISPLLVEYYSWKDMFHMASFFGISMSIIVLTLPQINYEKQRNRRLSTIIGELKQIFSKKDYKFWKRGQFIISSGAAISIVPMLPIIMERDFSYNLIQIALGSFLFAIGSLFGSVIIGVLSDKKDTPRLYTNLVFLFTTTIIAGILFIWISKLVFQLIFIFMVGFFAGAYEAFQLKIIQESSSDLHEGTIFSIYTSISNIGQFLLGGFLIVYIADQLKISIFIPLLISILPLIFSIKPIKTFKY